MLVVWKMVVLLGLACESVVVVASRRLRWAESKRLKGVEILERVLDLGG